jgi:hypothetical protein
MVSLSDTNGSENEMIKYREDGRANFYGVETDKKWIAVVQLNGEFMQAKQDEIMQAITEAITNIIGEK